MSPYTFLQNLATWLLVISQYQVTTPHTNFVFSIFMKKMPDIIKNDLDFFLVRDFSMVRNLSI